MKILVVEDDAALLDYLVAALRDKSHSVEPAASGRRGLFLATDGSFDLLVLDRLIPDMDGLSILKGVRAVGMNTPALFLTTFDGVDDRVEGLNAGADDYLVKPFAVSEFLARVEALLRRNRNSEQGAVLKVGALALNIYNRELLLAGQEIKLHDTELRLLEFLMRHADQVVTRKMLLEKVWDFHFEPRTNIVEANICRLRNKIGRNYDGEIIETLRGVGYCLKSIH